MKYYTKILILLLFCVLVPCVTIFSVTNILTQKKYIDSVSDSQVNELQAISNMNQVIVNNIEESALNFSMEQNVRNMNGVVHLDTVLKDPEQTKNLKRVLDKLNDIIRVNSLYDSVYFYLKESDYIISSQDSVVSLDNFSDLAWLDSYQMLLRHPQQSKMIPARTLPNRMLPENATQPTCLTYIYPITRFTSSFEGVIVFNINEQKLLDLYWKQKPQGNLFLYDGQGEKLASINNIGEPFLSDDPLLKHILETPAPTEEYTFFTQENKKLQCTYLRTADGNFVFVGIQSIAEPLKNIASFQLIFLIFLLIYVPFVALLVFILSKRLYNPIYQLGKELSNSKKIPINTEDFDISSVSKAVRTLIQEDTQLFTDAEKEKIRNATFLRILSEDFSDHYDETQLIMPYPHNVCIIAALDMSYHNLTNENNFDARVRVLLRLLEQELSNSSQKATAIRHEWDTFVLIFSFEQPTLAVKKELPGILKEVGNKSGHLMGYSVSFAMGGLAHATNNIRQSFHEAKNALQYRFIYGRQSILFYDETIQHTDNYCPNDRIKYLQSALENGRKSEVLKTLDELITDVRHRTNLSFICVSLFVENIATILIEYLLANNINLSDLVIDNGDIYRELWHNITIEETGTWFAQLISIAMDYQNSIQTQYGNKYMRNILAYVKENYTKNITIDTIAEHSGISYSHARKLFKDATGRNLTDYISNLRIQKAKDLLLETNYSIKEIASMCGFNNERSFSRTFAQLENMAPSKFKEMHKNG